MTNGPVKGVTSIGQPIHSSWAASIASHIELAIVQNLGKCIVNRCMLNVGSISFLNKCQYVIRLTNQLIKYLRNEY